MQTGAAWSQASCALDRQTIVKEAYAVAPGGLRNTAKVIAGLAGAARPTGGDRG